VSALKRLAVAVGHVWAAPITLFGVGQALVGARFHSFGEWAVLQFVARERGPIAAFMRRFHVAAYTLGGTITYARTDGPHDPGLVAHERWHVVQTMVLGPLMPVAYYASSVIEWARGNQAYRDNWFERQARAAAAQHAPLRVVRGE
jgi:hypothetical protein